MMVRGSINSLKAIVRRKGKPGEVNRSDVQMLDTMDSRSEGRELNYSQD